MSRVDLKDEIRQILFEEYFGISGNWGFVNKGKITNSAYSKGYQKISDHWMGLTTSKLYLTMARMKYVKGSK